MIKDALFGSYLNCEIPKFFSNNKIQNPNKFATGVDRRVKQQFIRTRFIYEDFSLCSSGSNLNKYRRIIKE